MAFHALIAIPLLASAPAGPSGRAVARCDRAAPQEPRRRTTVHHTNHSACSTWMSILSALEPCRRPFPCPNPEAPVRPGTGLMYLDHAPGPPGKRGARTCHALGCGGGVFMMRLGKVAVATVVVRCWLASRTRSWTPELGT